MGERRVVYRVLVGRSMRKNHLQDPSIQDNISMDLQEVGSGGEGLV
jgi:hypothetical protein